MSLIYLILRQFILQLPVLIVKLTDAGSVQLDKNLLEIGYSAGENVSSVKGNLVLPISGNHGTTISWESTNPGVISNAGVVTRSASGDSQVTLTATISKNAATTTKAFNVTVIITDVAAVSFSKADLSIGYGGVDTSASVTQNLSLTSSGIYATSISWVSSNVGVISNTGIVTRPVGGDVSVTMTSTISKNGVSDSKEFVLTVKVSDTGAVALDKISLAIGYTGADTSSDVTQDIALPLSGPNDTTITWSSNHPGVVSNSGVVTTPNNGSVSVTMTAIIAKNAESSTKIFNLMVLDKTLPTLTNVTISSSNETGTVAKVGDVITLSITASEHLNSAPSVSIGGHGATVTGIGPYLATYTMTSGDTQGVVPIAIDYSDNSGNVGTRRTNTTDASSVTFYLNSISTPIVTGITPTNDTTPTWNWTSGVGGNGTFRYKFGDSDLTTGATITTSLSYISPVLTDGTYSIYVQERDVAGNWSSAGTLEITIDTSLPSSPVLTGTSLTNDTTPTWTWTDVGGNGIYRYKINNTDLSLGATTITGLSYTAGPLEDGIYTLYVQAMNSAGSWSGVGSFPTTIDATRPIITIAPYETNVTNTSIVVNASTNEGTLNATSHTFLANGLFTFEVSDLAGNTTSTTIIITNINTSVAPSQVILDSSEATINVGNTITLHEIVKPGYSTNKDVNWSTNDSGVAAVANGVVTGLSEGMATITATTQDGGLTTSCAVNVVASNVPTVVISSLVGTLTHAHPSVSVAFSVYVSDFDQSDLVISNAVVSGFLDNGNNTYTVDLNPISQGTINIKVPASVVQDVYSAPNTASNDLKVLFDNISSIPTISTNVGSVTNTPAIPMTVTFDEPVYGMTSIAVTVTNGSVVGLSGVGSTYNFTIIPTMYGAITCQVQSGVVDDEAGNSNVESNIVSVTYVAPTPTPTPTSSSVSGGGNIQPETTPSPEQTPIPIVVKTPVPTPVQTSVPETEVKPVVTVPIITSDGLYTNGRAYSIFNAEESRKLLEGNRNITLKTDKMQVTMMARDVTKIIDEKNPIEIKAVFNKVTNLSSSQIRGMLEKENGDIKTLGSIFEVKLTERVGMTNYNINKLENGIKIKIDIVGLNISKDIDYRKVVVAKIRKDGTLSIIGGKFDGKNIEFKSDELTSFIVLQNNTEYKDISKSFANDEINVLTARNVVSGDTKEGKFEPKKEITRGEFVTLIAKAMELSPVEYRGAFGDVNVKSEESRYIQALYDKGLVSGYGKDFGTKDSLTREQLIKLSVDMYTYVVGKVVEKKELNVKFKDQGNISEFARDKIASAVELGLIKGYQDNTFNPGKSITKEESAAIIYRLMSAAKIF